MRAEPKENNQHNHGLVVPSVMSTKADPVVQHTCMESGRSDNLMAALRRIQFSRRKRHGVVRSLHSIPCLPPLRYSNRESRLRVRLMKRRLLEEEVKHAVWGGVIGDHLMMQVGVQTAGLKFPKAIHSRIFEAISSMNQGRYVLSSCEETGKQPNPDFCEIRQRGLS